MYRDSRPRKTSRAYAAVAGNGPDEIREPRVAGADESPHRARRDDRERRVADPFVPAAGAVPGEPRRGDRHHQRPVQDPDREVPHRYRSGRGSGVALTAGEFHALQRHRVEIRFDALTLFVERVNLVAAAVDLDVAHFPALRLQHRSQLFLRLPLVRRPRVAGGEAGRAGDLRDENASAAATIVAAEIHNMDLSFDSDNGLHNRRLPPRVGPGYILSVARVRWIRTRERQFRRPLCYESPFAGRSKAWPRGARNTTGPFACKSIEDLQAEAGSHGLHARSARCISSCSASAASWAPASMCCREPPPRISRARRS